MKRLLHFSLCIAGLPASAQLGSSLDLRHAIPNGPYPIYLAIAGVHNSGVSAFTGMLNPKTSIFHGLEGRVRQYGVEVNVGAVVNEENFLSIRGLSVHSVSGEVGFKFLTRSFGDGSGNVLNFQQQQLSLRIGWRWNFFYPITAHIQAGPIFYHSARVASDPASGAKTFSYDGSFDLHGLDLRGRIVFFDPVGAAGGLGVYVEGQFLYSTAGPDVNKLRSIFQGELDHNSRGDFTMGVLSVGVTIPLALRMR